jgi:hypothetical protein
MSDDPIDDYLQALIQEASVPAAAGSNGQATATAAAASEAPIQNPPADAGQPPCPPPAATAAGHSDDLLAELDAAFDQARAGYEQAQSAAAPLATDPEQPARPLPARAPTTQSRARRWTQTAAMPAAMTCWPSWMRPLTRPAPAMNRARPQRRRARRIRWPSWMRPLTRPVPAMSRARPQRCHARRIRWPTWMPPLTRRVRSSSSHSRPTRTALARQRRAR